MSDTIFLKNLHDISRFGELPSNWQSTTIRQICELGRGRVISQEEINEHPGPYPVYSSQTSNNGEMGYLNSFDFEGEWITWTTDGANAGTVFYRSGRFNCTNVCGTLSAKNEGSTDLRFLHYHLGKIAKNYVSYLGNPKLMNDVVGSIALHLPPLPEQKKIARILTTVDNLIEKTKALIEKYKAIKQGMMHDLFTRGVDQNGKLRPPYEEAPHLYKESPLGWIPKEWDVDLIGNVVESAIDGPFGSNLKTAHYVDEAGVRVIRLQNIDATRYDDTDKAFIPESHAQALSRHKVIGGDVIVAALGEDRHPVGRACLYPQSLPSAINKADCFRIRCNSLHLSNSFLMSWLNTEFVQPEIQRFRQGVTLQRINLSNMKRISVPLPHLSEQRVISSRLQQIDDLMLLEEKRQSNLGFQKTALMQDLLTGKVRVKVEELEEELSNA